MHVARRVLVVDDEAGIRRVLRAFLEAEGFDVTEAATGRAALDEVRSGHPDLVLLDVMLPDLDGFEVLRRIRATSQVGVIMLTARAEEVDTLVGLAVGADDYVTKPFSPRELVLRVQSLLRRVDRALLSVPVGGDRPPPALVDGDLEIDLAAHRASLAGRDLTLTVREFELLAWFLAHPGQAVGRAELMSQVWHWEYGDQSTVTVHVRRLREKLERDPSAPVRLVTVFGVGYRWDPAR